MLLSSNMNRLITAKMGLAMCSCKVSELCNCEVLTSVPFSSPPYKCTAQGLNAFVHCTRRVYLADDDGGASKPDVRERQYKRHNAAVPPWPRIERPLGRRHVEEPRGWLHRPEGARQYPAQQQKRSGRCSLGHDGTCAAPETHARLSESQTCLTI